jgi:DNA-binding MarR family transcriptional regulator
MRPSRQSSSNRPVGPCRHTDATPTSDGHRRTTPGSPSRIAPTAAKALRVIELLAAEPSTPFSLAEMQRRLGYSHGNLHAICTTLVAMGHLRRDHGERTYRLGPALLSIGAAARAAFPSVDVALPFLHTLAAELDSECHAAMRSGDSIIVVSVGTPQLEYGVRGERFPSPRWLDVVAWASPGRETSRPRPRR